MQRTRLGLATLLLLGILTSCDLFRQFQRTNTLTVTLSAAAGPVNTAVTLSAGGTDVSQFQWTIESRPAGDNSTIVNPSSQNTTLVPLTAGHYLIQVRAVQEGIAGAVFASKPFDAY